MSTITPAPNLMQSKPAQTGTTGPDTSEPGLVIGIGAAAGALEAIIPIIKILGPDVGITALIAQHVAPDHRSQMQEILSRETNLQVLYATDGDPIHANTVYVNQTNQNLLVKNGRMRVEQPTPGRQPTPSIDHFFASLASEYGANAIGIVLSGDSQDGLQGCQAIREADGLIVVQSPESAKHDRMPRSIIAAGLADIVLSPPDISAHLLEVAIVAQKSQNKSVVSTLNELREELPGLLERIHQRTNYDFSSYKLSTLERRVMNRMTQAGFGNMQDYLSFIARNPDELDELQRNFLISVTEFFRDPWAFTELRKAVASLCDNTADDTPIRVWVTACATGEEAYSIAMLFAEHLGDDLKNRNIKIFATDVDEIALKVGRRGIYPRSALKSVHLDEMKKYFEPADGALMIRRDVRELIVFAHHDLLKDPPFLRMHLICCRNLLIYLNRNQQRDIVFRFYSALQPKHYLFLGGAESPGQEGESLFDVVDVRARLYRRHESASLHDLPIRLSGARSFSTRQPEDELQSSCVRMLASSYIPPSVLMDDQLRPIDFYGEMPEFLNTRRDDARNGISALVSAPYVEALRSLIAMLVQSGERQMRSDPIRDPATGRTFSLVLRRFMQMGSSKYILSFEEPKSHSLESLAERGLPSDAPPGSGNELADELERNAALLQLRTEELESCREELELLQNQHTTYSRELKSSFQEMEYSNGVLQASLEMMSARIDKIQLDHDQLESLYNALNLGCVLVDENLIIRVITPPAQPAFGADHNSIGRALPGLAHQLPVNDLVGMIDRVIETGKSHRYTFIFANAPHQLLIVPLLNSAGKGAGAALLLQELASD